MVEKQGLKIRAPPPRPRPGAHVRERPRRGGAAAAAARLPCRRSLAPPPASTIRIFRQTAQYSLTVQYLCSWAFLCVQPCWLQEYSVALVEVLVLFRLSSCFCLVPTCFLVISGAKNTWGKQGKQHQQHKTHQRWIMFTVICPRGILVGQSVSFFRGPSPRFQSTKAQPPARTSSPAPCPAP